MFESPILALYASRWTTCLTSNGKLKHEGNKSTRCRIRKPSIFKHLYPNISLLPQLPHCLSNHYQGLSVVQPPLPTTHGCKIHLNPQNAPISTKISLNSLRKPTRPPKPSPPDSSFYHLSPRLLRGSCGPQATPKQFPPHRQFT